MSRPTSLLKDATLYWVIRLYNSSGVLVDADSTPTVAVRKNSSSVGDSVTVTKRSATTGIYDCSYNPSGEVEGDQFTIEESALISTIPYPNSWEFRVFAAERGTDSAYTGTPPTAGAIADAVWDESTSGHQTAGTTGKALTDAATVTVSPLQAIVPQRVDGTRIDVFVGDTSAVGPIAITDEDGNAVDLSGKTLQVVIETQDGTDRATVSSGSITVSGASSNQITFNAPSAAVSAVRPSDLWSLRDTADGNRVLAYGPWNVIRAAKVDA